MPRSAQLALFIAAALMIPLVVVLLLNLVGIEVDPLLVIGGLVLLWAFWGGSSSAGSPGQSGRGGRGGDADEERRALARLQTKHADELIEEHRAGKISTERRNEQLRHILNAPPPDSKGPGPRRPS